MMRRLRARSLDTEHDKIIDLYRKEFKKHPSCKQPVILLSGNLSNLNMTILACSAL